MNLILEKIAKIRREMESGQGGTTIYADPIELEPPFEPFSFDFKKPSMLERLFPKAQVSPKSINTSLRPLTFIRIRPSLEDEPSFGVARQVLIALSLRYPCSFEVIGTSKAITFQMGLDPQDRAGTLGILSTAYPRAEMFEAEDLLKASVPATSLIHAYRLADSHFIPLNCEFKEDPYRAIFGVFNGLDTQEFGVYQVLFRQVQHDWRENILKVSRSEFDPTASPFIDLDLSKISKKKCESGLFCVSIRLIGSSSRVIQRLERFFQQFCGDNQLVRIPSAFPQESIRARSNHSLAVILAAAELACLIHMPAPETLSPIIEQAQKTAPAPAIARRGDGIIFGENTHRGQSTSVAIGYDWCIRHILVMGATGAGKTLLLANLFKNFIRSHGCIFIDPSGDSARAFLKLVPPERASATFYLDPCDPVYAPGFNPLEMIKGGDADLIRGSVLTAFRRLYGTTGMGPRSEWILSNGLATILKSPYKNRTLLDLSRLFTDKTFRNSILATVVDEQIERFWKAEFEKLPESAILPLLNKLHGFLGQEKISSMLCQPTGINLERLIHDKSIGIMQLSKGEMGEPNAVTLGFLLLSTIQQAVLGLSKVPPQERDYFTIILDEAHLFLGNQENVESLNSLLSESRKYKIVMVLATQFLAQADRKVRDSLLGNVGTLMCFRVGIDDAMILQKECGTFSAEDLLNLFPGEAIIRVGRAQDSFNIKTPFIDLETLPEGCRQEIIQHSREQYYTRRDLIKVKSATPRVGFDASPDPETNQILSVEERAFLEYVHGNPTVSVTRIYKVQHLSAYKGDKIKRSLREQGLIKEIVTHLGIGSRIAKFLIITPKGFEALCIQYGSDSGKGGVLHRYFQSVISSYARNIGYRVEIEESIPGTTEAVDIGLEKGGRKIAIEISTSQSAYSSQNGHLFQSESAQ